MATREHVDRLLKGIDGWNQWRISSPDEIPDLSDINISYTIRNSGEHSILHNGKHYILDNIDLSRAKLKKTSFHEISLVGSKFNYAKLQNANFTHADLQTADFTGSELKQADFSHSNLIGADFTSAKPWEAILYPPPHDPLNKYVIPTRIQDGIVSECINNVGELINICKILKKHYKKYKKEEYTIYFRGERSNSWNLLPSVKRSSSVEEGEMLLDLLSRQPEQFSGITTAMAQWVLAQHYGLKTRLLDITRNPLVGLFFASQFHDKSRDPGRLHIFAVPKSFRVLSVYYSRFIKPFDSDAIRVIANFAKLSREQQEVILGSGGTSGMSSDNRVIKYDTAMRRLYHFINQERPNFEKRIDIRDLFSVFVVEPQKLFERIRAQSGAFMISAFHCRFEEKELNKFNNGIPYHHHYKFIIPDCAKKNIQDELELLNITKETLFPSLEETATAINHTHLQRSKSAQEL